MKKTLRKPRMRTGKTHTDTSELSVNTRVKSEEVLSSSTVPRLPLKRRKLRQQESSNLIQKLSSEIKSMEKSKKKRNPPILQLRKKPRNEGSFDEIRPHNYSVIFKKSI